ncbi:sensor histidine kinase [Aquimarina sp. SS2-1]|uniref:sensor histidine kinase n=1 Tax=Aquimarina besae TaxID=3342247 RepID=UPI00366DFFDE
MISILGIVICTLIVSNLFAPSRMSAIGELRPLRRRPPSNFLITLLFLTISYVIATFLETFLFAQKKEEETIRSKNENLQTELKLLKSQINPHFLFNSLNNIYALSVIDSDKTQESISYLSDMLRYVLYECERNFVPIKKEITYIENYIKLFSLKSSNPYNITTDFNSIDQSVSIAPMLFIPFIENAFKHSNIEKPNNSFIRIKIVTMSGNVTLTLENSIPKEKIHKDKLGGIGIENVGKRLNILYPNKHQLLINEYNDVFKVELNINLIDYA